MQYTLILKNEKLKNYHSIGQLLVLFNLLGFTFVLMKSDEAISGNMLLFFSIIVTAAYSIIAFYNRFTKKAVPHSWHRTIFLLCALVWISEKFWLLSIALAIFVLLDLLANRILSVKISEKKIIFPSFPKKEISWQELNNLILKDDLLTIDFKNNKLIQYLILNSSEEISESSFNEFCKKCLLKN